MNKSRIRWEGHVTSMGENRNACEVLVRKTGRRRDHVNGLGVDGRITIKSISNKHGGKV
jgi:hypothetical protein